MARPQTDCKRRSVPYHDHMKQIAVDLHPDLIDPAALQGEAVAVVDVLRATTTIVHALAAGARTVVISGEVEETRENAKAWWECATILGGERNGLKIVGFDLGNSPGEYTRAAVAGRAVFFTTTNGTRAMLTCHRARRIIASALVNRGAVVAALASEPHVRIVCAGTRGEVTRDDALAAGAIVAGLVDPAPAEYALDDEAAMVRDMWNGIYQPLAAKSAEEVRAGLVDALRNSLGGRNLIELGLDRDIETAAELDKFNLAPELNPATMSLALR